MSRRTREEKEEEDGDWDGDEEKTKVSKTSWKALDWTAKQSNALTSLHYTAISRPAISNDFCSGGLRCCFFSRSSLPASALFSTFGPAKKETTEEKRRKHTVVSGRKKEKEIAPNITWYVCCWSQVAGCRMHACCPTHLLSLPWLPSPIFYLSSLRSLGAPGR